MNKKSTPTTKDKTEMEGKVIVSFAALNPYYTTNITSAEEKEIRGADFISWGDGNRYPDYLFGLYNDVTLFRTIANGIADYVVGDGVKSNISQLSTEEAEELVKSLALDYALYGGFCIDVERSKEKKIAKILALPMKSIRSDKKNEFLFYSTDWSKSAGRVEFTKYGKFRPEGDEYSSIYYYKNFIGKTYPMAPLEGDGAIACETLKAISDFHFNNINNGFSSNYIVNMNNGVPTDEQKKEIEDNVTEKFTGYQNAGRPVIAFNADKDHETTITKIEQDDFDKKYEALRANSQQVLFMAYKAAPNLFGLINDNKGFAEENYNEAMKLFNRTVIRPIQKKICNAVDYITGQADSLTIKPFSIDWSDDAQEKVVE